VLVQPAPSGAVHEHVCQLEKQRSYRGTIRECDRSLYRISKSTVPPGSSKSCRPVAAPPF